MPPITSLGDRNCVADVDLSTARALPLDPDKRVSADLDATALCLQPTGAAKSAYVVFELPAAATPYLIDVTSVPIGQTLLSPRLMLLDGRGTLLREIPRDAFLFHGVSLYASLRWRPTERYLVVASDAASVGGQQSHIDGRSRAIPVPVGIGAVAVIHSGSEEVDDVTYAHNGRVTVTARPVPKG
jgi:hypothetical protein